MSCIEVTLLIIAGFLAGFINTLAGAGTIISLSILMFLGLPVNVANGTNRIAVLFQNFVAVRSFKKQKILDTRKGLWYAVPTAIGSVIGAQITVYINERIFEKLIACLMLVLMLFIIYKPEKWLKGQEELINKKTSFTQIILFFLIGIYGGFIHVGMGFFLLATIVIGGGYDLIKANAIKNYIVLLYIPFALAVFILNKQVNYKYGLVLSFGNIIGAYIAARYAVNWGTNMIRWLVIIVIIVASAQLLGILDFKTILNNFLFIEKL